MTANTRPLCCSTGTRLHLLLPSHLTKLYFPSFITIVWVFDCSLILFLPQFHCEAGETITSPSASAFFRVKWVFIGERDQGSTVAACFPGLGLKLQLFWKKHFGELHNWWPVFQLWVFSQYLWGSGGERLHRGWISIFTESSSSSFFLVLL